MERIVLARRIGLTVTVASIAAAVVMQVFLATLSYKKKQAAPKVLEVFKTLPNSPDYQIRITYPTELARTDDGSVIVTAVDARDHGKKVDIPETVGKGWKVKVSTHSFKIEPKDHEKEVRLFAGQDLEFLLKPDSSGIKRLGVEITYREPTGGKGDGALRQLAATVEIAVTPARRLFGLGEDAIEDIRTFATVVGLPGLLLLVGALVKERSQPKESKAPASMTQ
jgi:hypothetical protein